MERLERLASRNSRNSSMPPSADDLPGRTPPPRKPSRGGKRKPGKQPGAPGSHLAWGEHPDDTVPHFPEGTCACGADLAGAADLGVVASHQQVEIPLAQTCSCEPAQQASPARRPPSRPELQAERAIIEQLATAYEAGDVAGLVSLLTEDAVITAPLAGGAYLGPAAAASVFEAIFAQDRSYRLIPTRANRQPAFGVYVRDPATGVFHANGMLVLTLVGDRIRAMTRFDNSVIAKFGFPGGSPEPADLKQHPGRRPLPTGPMQDLALRVADRPPGSRPYVRRSSSAGGIVGRA